MAVLCIVSATALSSCGKSEDPVSPTPRSAFRSTYPCELLTRSMAARVLSITGPRRVGAQTLAAGVQQCIWARGRYKAIPQIALTIFMSERLYPPKETVASIQRGYERRALAAEGYRRLRGLGDRAFLISSGRAQSSVLISQGGTVLSLRLHLKQKPRSQPPPLRELERAARTISARFDPAKL